ncbi:MAG: biotin transporter BioY [Oscillospiraceae bacterium]|nr:biotin transporter BioY [Oscillospiraceae bacterium]
MKKITILPLTLCALFAALSVVLSQVVIPMGVVSVVFTQVSFLLAGALLGAKWGFLSQSLYVAMGAAGLSVFSGFHGGIGWLVGPTGGFLWGYPIAALLVGWITNKRGTKLPVLIAAMVVGDLIVYLPGVPWLAYVKDITIAQAVAAGMLPFLPFDAAKIAISVVLARILCPLLRKYRRT